MKDVIKSFTTCSMLLGICFLLALTSCNSADQKGILIDMGRSDPDRILNYYFSIYSGADPFASSLITKSDGQYFLDQDKLTGSLEVFTKYVDDGTLDWDELKAELKSSYYSRTGAPNSLADLKSGLNDSENFSLEVHGVMTEAKRRIELSKNDLQNALKNYSGNGSRIIYPSKTTFIASHEIDNQVHETTVMKKIDGDQWAYWVYDQEGRLSTQTQTEPRKLLSPTQCIGCHMGQKAFEPESSFPHTLKEKETRRRQIYVSDELRSERFTTLFDEHKKRDDSVLGLYATLYMAQLQLKTQNDLSETEKGILTSFR